MKEPIYATCTMSKLGNFTQGKIYPVKGYMSTIKGSKATQIKILDDDYDPWYADTITDKVKFIIANGRG